MTDSGPLTASAVIFGLTLFFVFLALLWLAVLPGVLRYFRDEVRRIARQERHMAARLQSPAHASLIRDTAEPPYADAIAPLKRAGE